MRATPSLRIIMEISSRMLSSTLNWFASVIFERLLFIFFCFNTRLTNGYQVEVRLGQEQYRVQSYLHRYRNYVRWCTHPPQRLIFDPYVLQLLPSKSWWYMRESSYCRPHGNFAGTTHGNFAGTTHGNFAGTLFAVFYFLCSSLSYDFSFSRF